VAVAVKLLELLGQEGRVVPVLVAMVRTIMARLMLQHQQQIQEVVVVVVITSAVLLLRVLMA
jgi:hypothetical protein